jgi:hypothetical protein
MAADDAVRGKDFKLYRNVDVVYDSQPTWQLVTNVRDLTSNLEKALADASTRATSFRQQVGTLKDLNVDFQMVYTNTDVDVAAFELAFYNDSNMELLDLDGDIQTTGSRGVRFMAQVTKFTRNEALEDVGLIDVSIVVGYAPTNAPRRVHVTTPGTVTDTVP